MPTSSEQPRKARNRGDRSAEYKKDYQRRADQARQAGYKNRAQFDKGRAVPYAEKPRDRTAAKARERERALTEGFANPNQRRRFNADKRGGTVQTVEQWRNKLAVLKAHGVTESEFNKMRAANLEYVRKPFENWNPLTADKLKRVGIALTINEYDVDRDLDPSDWSDRRVGYVTSFYRAIVDRRSNYSSLMRQDEFGNPIRRLWKNRLPLTNVQQYEYLVKYSEIMSVSEFERRYGAQLNM